jgi:CRP-like cAMP-binding protein
VKKPHRVPIFESLTGAAAAVGGGVGLGELRASRKVNGKDGEPIEHLYVILEGELSITKKVDGGEEVIHGGTGFQVRSRSRRVLIAEERRRPQAISGVDLMINEMGDTTAME